MKVTIILVSVFVVAGFAEPFSSSLEETRRPIPDVNDLPATILRRSQRSPEPEPQGSLSATYSQQLSGPDRRPTYNFDYNHRLLIRKDGNIDLSVGAQQIPGRRVEPTVGLTASFRIRR